MSAPVGVAMAGIAGQGVAVFAGAVADRRWAAVPAAVLCLAVSDLRNVRLPRS